MYYIKISEDEPHSLIYYCRNCGNENMDLGKENIYVSRKVLDSSGDNYLNYINKYTKYDKTLPRVDNVPCINSECKSNKEKDVKKDIIMYRYDDKNLQYLYLCTLCDKVWKL